MTIMERWIIRGAAIIFAILALLVLAVKVAHADSGWYKRTGSTVYSNRMVNGVNSVCRTHYVGLYRYGYLGPGDHLYEYHLNTTACMTDHGHPLHISYVHSWLNGKTQDPSWQWDNLYWSANAEGCIGVGCTWFSRWEEGKVDNIVPVFGTYLRSEYPWIKNSVHVTLAPGPGGYQLWFSTGMGIN